MSSSCVYAYVHLSRHVREIPRKMFLGWQFALTYTLTGIVLSL